MNMVFNCIFCLAILTASCTPEQDLNHVHPSSLDTDVIVPPAWAFGIASLKQEMKNHLMNSNPWVISLQPI
jgi:hypothetical protein